MEISAEVEWPKSVGICRKRGLPFAVKQRHEQVLQVIDCFLSRNKLSYLVTKQCLFAVLTNGKSATHKKCASKAFLSPNVGRTAFGTCFLCVVFIVSDDGRIDSVLQSDLLGEGEFWQSAANRGQRIPH